MKELIRISETIHVHEDDVSTLEFQDRFTDYWGSTQKMGTIIVMKSGRKVFAEGLKPDQVKEKLNKTSGVANASVG